MKTTFDLPDELLRETVRATGARVTLTAAGLLRVARSAGAPASHMALADLLALEQQAQAQEDAQRAGHLG